MVAKQSDKTKGWVNGQPTQWVRGHHARAKARLGMNAGNIPSHLLTEIDELNRTATCSRCGPVNIKRNNSRVDGWACTGKLHDRHSLTEINEAERKAWCRHCRQVVSIRRRGPADGDGAWLCCLMKAENDRRYRQNNLEHVKEMERSWHIRNRDYVRAKHLWNKYGITIEQWDALFEAQGGVCATCKKPTSGNGPSGQSLHVDHDHRCCPGKKSCGKCIRGLLCTRCNLTAGALGDDLETLRAMVKYLENPPGLVLGKK